MSTVKYASCGISPEKLEALMHAARVERARAVRRALRVLFRQRRNDEAWVQAKAPDLSLSLCR